MNKDIGIFTLAAIALLALITTSSASEISALKAIKAEPKVKDAVHASSGVKWQVGVLDDGTPRYGYASYICELLREHGVVNSSTKPSTELVRIVDIVKVTNGQSFRKASLGTVDCVTYKQRMP